MKRLKIFLAIFAILGIITLTACGSGGNGKPPGEGTATISGIAAAGAPIIGQVYLKDSAGITKGPNPISSDGSFSFDVTGLAPPFYLRAIGSVGGEGYDLYSIATSSGVANINPLTNLAVAAAADASDPASVYNNPSQYSINQTLLDQAVAEIKGLLQPLLDAYSANVNPFTDPYTANHTGLDAVFDVVKVEIDTSTGIVTVTDKTTGNEMAQTAVDRLTTPSDPLTTNEVPSTQTITDLQAIESMFSNLATQFNKGDSPTAGDLEPFVASNFGVHDGQDRNAYINWWLSGASSIQPKTITKITVAIIGMNGNDYIVSAVFYFSDGSFYSDPNWLSIITKEGGAWKLTGNGYKSSLESMHMRSLKYIKTDGMTITESGIQLIIYDNGNNGIQSALITGPGLPSGGVTLSKPANEPIRLRLDQSYWNSQIYTEFYKLSDTNIDFIPDNAEYMVVVKDSNGTQIETRTWKILKRPYKISELTDGHFPTPGGITSHALSAANIGGTLNFTYSKPASYVVGGMYSGLSFWSTVSGDSAWYGNELLLNQTSSSITSGSPSGWTPDKGTFTLSATDNFRREMSYRWEFGDQAPQGDTTAPTLASSNPANGATNVSVTSRTISFTFSEAMQPGYSVLWSSNVNASNFTRSWSSDQRTITYTYNTDFPANSQISWTLNPSGWSLSFKDLAGNPLPADTYSGNFTTGGGGDSQGTYTASGTYSYNSGTGLLVVNITNSDFPSNCGPNVGTEQFTVNSVTSITMIWTESDGSQITWTRKSGSGASIVGTWEFTDNSSGNSWYLTMNSDGSFTVIGHIMQCGGGGSTTIYHEVSYASIMLDGDGSDWAGIAAVENDPEGDDITGYAGADIKLYKIAHDANYIYIWMEMWDGAPDDAFIQAGGIYEIFFGESASASKSIGVLNIYHNGTTWAVRTAEGGITDGTVAVGNGIELRIPKSGFGNIVHFTTQILVHLLNTAADGDYTGIAENFLTQIATITVDGNSGDWASLMPIYTDAQGDSTGGNNVDIKRVFAAMDSNYAYVMVETYGVPIHSSANIEMNFSYKTGQHFTHGSLDDLHTNISNSTLTAWNDNNLDGAMESFPISGYTVVRGNVMEMRIPLSQLENAKWFIPTFVNIWASSASIGDDPTTIIP